MRILNLKDESRHIEKLAEWHQRQWAALNPGQTLEQRIAYMQAYLNEGLVPSTFIAEGPELMGSAAIIAKDMDTKPDWTPWLASVFVAPKYRNRGVGSRLVEHVMQQAQDAGIDRLFLFTPDRVSFYQRLGWTMLAEEAYRGHTVTVMTADLLDTSFRAYPAT
ncbi:GNAT family N-acetyltransferase [Methylomonas sp. MgM2]